FLLGFAGEKISVLVKRTRKTQGQAKPTSGKKDKERRHTRRDAVVPVVAGHGQGGGARPVAGRGGCGASGLVPDPGRGRPGQVGRGRGTPLPGPRSATAQEEGEGEEAE